MSLYTGKKLHAYVWKELPIDEDVIERVEYLATKEKQPYHMDNNPIFEWSPGIAIEEDSNDEDTGVEQEPQAVELEVIDDEEYEEPEEQETRNNRYITDDKTVLHEESGREESDIDEVINNMENVDNQIDDIMNDINQSRYHVEESDKNDISGDNEPEDIILDDLGESQEEIETRPRRANAGLGVQRIEPATQGQSHHDRRVQLAMKVMNKTMLESERTKTFDTQGAYKRAVKVMFTQMSAHKGIKLFGGKAISAIIKELKQFEYGPMPGKNVISSIYTDMLTSATKEGALDAIN